MSESVTPAACALPDSPMAGAMPGIMTCVHCGFCLQSCPTYLALGDENDSPRGRIVLMRAVAEGTLPIDDADVQTHIDRCLGCRACETACPSGVPYGQMLEATRATLATVTPQPIISRVVLAVFAHPIASALAMAGARIFRATRLARLLSWLPGRLGFAFAMLAATERPLPTHRYARRGSGARGSVATLRGCVMNGLFAETNRATERVLDVNDYRVVDVPDTGCCGALHAHAGDLDGARALARRNIAAFERAGAQPIAVNASGCGAMMKEYEHLLADDPLWRTRAAAIAARTSDVSELLAAAGPASGGPVNVRATADAPCHVVHAQRLVREPAAVLASIPGLDLVPLPDAEHCCGSAGIYNLLEFDLASQVLAPKLAHIAGTGASLVVTGNPGCLMHIGAGLRLARRPVRAIHPIDLLDASYAAMHRP